MAEKPKWLKMGTILKSKDGKSSYLKVVADVTLKEGQNLSVQDPRKRPGITEEQLAKIPPYIKAEVYVPPPKSE